MNRFLILFVALATICLLTFPHKKSFATGTPAPGTGSLAAAQASAQQGGGQCDLTAYKGSICKTESNCNYTLANSIGATGMYQFMPGTAAGLKSYQQAPASCKQTGTKNVGLARDACSGTQEAMMDEFTMKNLNYIKTSPKCAAARAAAESGKQVTGYKTGGRVGSVNCAGKSSCSCATTWSGLLAGAHLGGAGGICSTYSTGKDVDDGATSRLFYVCEHGGYPVPATDCTPQQYKTENGTITQPPGDYSPWVGPTPAAGIGTNNFNALSDQLKAIWVGAFKLMTSQLSTTMMQQVQVIGTFFDAKHQLETQRLMQQKVAQAHKDYHPSVQMCEIGTFTRDLANSDIRAELSKTAASRAMLDRALASGDTKTVQGNYSDAFSRREAYIEKFCNQKDNMKQNEALCKESGDPEQQNADINFTQTIDAPLTLNINLLDGEEESLEKENLFAFLDYIFMHDSFPFVPKSKTEYASFIEPYQDMRSLVAMRSVAQNSFANIIAQKTSGPETEDGSASPFLKALMREIGLEDQAIEDTIGKNPSYYAQMEVLTKKIYQHPEFISNLYDKPTNVKRIRAAMTAIKLMQDRDIHDSMMRREMLVSMILELRLRQKQTVLQNQLEKVIANEPGVVNEQGEVEGGTADDGFAGN